MVLPEGFALPDGPYLAGLLLALLIVVAVLYRIQPVIREHTIVGFAPWMAAGGALHVVAVEGIVTGDPAQLLGTPAVYLSTAVLAGIAWIIAEQRPGSATSETAVSGVIALFGVMTLGIVLVVIIQEALARHTVSIIWPMVGVAVTVIGTVIVWLVVGRLLDPIAETTGWVGLLVVFAHLLDAISTTIGVDVLGGGERSPLPRAIMDAAGALPTADVIGVGWAFILVKLVISVGILWLFIPFVRDEPPQAYALLGAVAAIGLGPGVHNLLLFLLAG